jgi:predicted RNA-binding protein with RPS1 domain
MDAFPPFRSRVSSESSLELGRELLDLADEVLERRAAVGALLDADARLAKLPAATLLALVRAWREYASWRSAACSSSLPEAVSAVTGGLAELRLVEGLSERGIAPSVPVAEAAVSCLSVARREGQVRGMVRAEAAGEGALRAGELTGRFALGEVPAARWLAWRRLEREGALSVVFELSESGVADQLEARQQAGDAGLLRALMQGLPESLCLHLDRSAQRGAEDEAIAAYRGLLRSPPVRAESLGALYVGSERRPAGAALVRRDGALYRSLSFPKESGWDVRVRRFVEESGVTVWVLPSTALDRERLTRLRKALPGSPELVKPAGVAAARKALEAELRGPPQEVLSAVVLARRALAPLEEWGRLDPLELGLAEYQHDLDSASLRACLEDVREQVRREGGARAGERLAAAPGGRLNPLVRSLDDLRPGMELDVQVTNLASFGAFVNFGLATEGLIHISELADHRVSSPSEVVRIGQRLRARVLSVESDRGRVSFTLRKRSSPGGPSGRGKAEALAKLNKLFS